MDIVTPCQPSPCGANAICKELNGAGSCSCVPEYTGDPYQGCRPECTSNVDCIPTKACVRFKCLNPCVGLCGQNADCHVIHHSPSCTCRSGYTGDPFSSCRPEPPKESKDFIENLWVLWVFVAHFDTSLMWSYFVVLAIEYKNPCEPSPCGSYSQCREVNGQAVCSCLPSYIGSPPACRPECTINAECDKAKTCVNQKCTDPCPGTCGTNANCRVINHSPICSCYQGYTGDPFTRCYHIPRKLMIFISSSGRM